MNERQVANKALELADELESRDMLDFLSNNTQFYKKSLVINAAIMLRSQEKYINLLHKLCNANGIGVGRNLLTGEVIPFEVEDEK